MYLFNLFPWNNEVHQQPTIRNADETLKKQCRSEKVELKNRLFKMKIK